MQTLKQIYRINAPISEVWQALVNPKYIVGWGGGPAKMSDKENVEFSLWGGSIWGKNIRVISEKSLAQEWFSESEHSVWKEPSTVTFTLEGNKNGTIVELLHKNVPDEDAKDIAEGWKEYYLGPLKDYLENK